MGSSSHYTSVLQTKRDSRKIHKQENRKIMSVSKTWFGIIVVLALVLCSDLISASSSQGFQNRDSSDSNDAATDKRTLNNMISRIMKRDYSSMVARVMKRGGQQEQDSYDGGKRSLKSMVARVMKREYSNMVTRVMKRLVSELEEPEYNDYYYIDPYRNKKIEQNLSKT